MSRKKFAGVLPPIATPLTKHGSLDRKALKRIVRYLLYGGVHGLFVGGTTGEGPNLTEQQWSCAVETVVDAAPKSIPVYVGVIEPSTPRVVQKVKKLSRPGKLLAN